MSQGWLSGLYWMELAIIINLTHILGLARRLTSNSENNFIYSAFCGITECSSVVVLVRETSTHVTSVIHYADSSSVTRR